MADNRFHGILLGFLGLMMVTTAYLVVLDTQSPGFCPAYPLIGTPACIVVLGYQALIVAALLLPVSALSRGLFYGVAGLTFLTGVFFSYREITEVEHQCPQIFGIPLPLCFTVPLAMVLVVVLGYLGRPRRL